MSFRCGVCVTYVIMLKQHFLAYKCLFKLCLKEPAAISLCLFLSLCCWIWVNTPYTFAQNLLIMYLPLLLCLCFSESSKISGQIKARQLKFLVIVNVYLCGKFSSSPALYTNSKYVNYVWTVFCLSILMLTFLCHSLFIVCFF